MDGNETWKCAPEAGEDLLRDIFMDPEARAAEKAEGQPEGSEHGPGYGTKTDCICGRNFATVWGLREHLTKARRRLDETAVPAPVPDDATTIVMHTGSHEVPDDEAVEARHVLTTNGMGYFWCSCDRHVAHVLWSINEHIAEIEREAVQAHGERIAEAIEAFEDENDSTWSKYGRHALVQAARIARDLTREAIR